MELKFDARFPGVNRTVSQPRAQLTTKTSRNDLSFSSSEALQSALQQVPDVRQTVLERAASLVNDPQYPSSQVMQQLASRLANHLMNSDGQ